MIDDNCPNKHNKKTENIDAVEYPVNEKLMLDNGNVAVVTHETESKVRIGLVHTATSSVEDNIQADHSVVDK